MRVDSIKLCGWRSYDLDGIHIEGLKSINLFIGPNNSGKSNLSKYFNYLKDIASGDLPNGNAISVPANIDESQTWNWTKEKIVCEIALSKENCYGNGNRVSYHVDEYQVTLFCCHDINDDKSTLNIKVDGKFVFNDKGLICSDLEGDMWVDPTDDVPGFYDNKFYWSFFLTSLVFVDPIRHHSRNSENDQSYYFDGAKIIAELDSLRVNKASPSNWANYKNKIKLWLSDILSEKVTGIDIVGNDLCLEFESGLSFSLSQLGTGVSQIVMLLSHLWINKDKNLNVFLEEPEANLHPESVIKLVTIFEHELVNHKFFITTHSPSLIDCINSSWAVYRTSKSQFGASRITPNDNVIKYYETLDALGVKASQILQSNAILWVEGPSDRIYLKKWIDIFSDGECLEGKDYSFLYFGGSNLASFTVLDDFDESFINILSTSRKAFLIADSDCSTAEKREEDSFKKYLESMIDRVRSANNDSSGVEAMVEDYVKVWVTEGREIENYICNDLLFEVLTETGIKRESVGKGKSHKKLRLKAGDCFSFVFEKFDSFDKAIANCYQYQDGSQLDQSAVDNISLSYAAKKVAIAKSVVDKIDRSQCSKFDLKEKMEMLIDFIKS